MEMLAFLVIEYYKHALKYYSVVHKYAQLFYLDSKENLKIEKKPEKEGGGCFNIPGNGNPPSGI